MQTSLAQFGSLVTFAICLIAFTFGDWRLKVASFTYFIAAILTIAVQVYFPDQTLVIFLLMDSLCLIIFLRLRWKSPLLWPILATICQIFSIASTLKPLLDPNYGLWASLTLLYLSGYGVLGALLFGTYEVIRRQAKLRINSYK